MATADIEMDVSLTSLDEAVGGYGRHGDGSYESDCVGSNDDGKRFH